MKIRLCFPFTQEIFPFMSYFQSILLGILQGLTEFLPVSSSGHLVVVPWLFNWQLQPDIAFAFNILVQVATIFSVVVYFWRDLMLIAWETLNALGKRQPFATWQARLGWWIVLGTIPAGVIGLLLKDFFEQMFNSPLAVLGFWLVTGAMLLLGEALYRRQQVIRDLSALTWLDALAVGGFQAFAILPGVSRSGSTMVGGLARGLDRNSAARFSFLLSIPIMLAAGLIGIKDLFDLPNLGSVLGPILVGCIVAALVGFASIHWLLGYVRRHSFVPFALYCFLAAIFSFTFWGIGVLRNQPLPTSGALAPAIVGATPATSEPGSPAQGQTTSNPAGIRIGLTNDTYAKIDGMNQYLPTDFRADLIEYPSQPATLQALLNGEIDALISFQPLDNLNAWQIGAVELALISPANNNDIGFGQKLWLSLDQIQRLFGGGILNWAELSLGDAPVQAIVRASDSDLGLLFANQVMQGQPIGGGALLRPAEGAVLQSVAGNPGTLGYVLAENITDSVLPVVVQGVLPGQEGYPFSAPILVITNGEPEGTLREWVAALQKAQ